MAGVNHDGATITFTVEDSNGAVIPENTVYTATATGSLVISAAVANVTSKTGYVGAAGAVVLDVAASSATAAGTGTLVLTIGGGSKTVYYRAVGPVSTITLANGGATALAGGVASEAGKITATTKDASGFVLTAPADDAISWELQTGSAGDAADVNEGGAAGVYDLADTACDAAASLTAVGDTAKSFTVRAKIGDLYSNYISVKCTDDGSYAKITGATASSKSAEVGGTITVTFTVQDGFGNALGYGAIVDLVADDATGHKLSGTYYPTVNAAAGDTKGSLATAGLTGDVTISTVGSWTNVITVDSWARNAYVIYTLEDADLSTDGAQAWTKTIKFASVVPTGDVVNITKSKRNVAKADFGTGAASLKVAFTIENVRNGNVKTYYRRANTSGVATFTLRFSGRFEVTATFGDEITDTVVLRK
jgi:hypothetical protein